MRPTRYRFIPAIGGFFLALCLLLGGCSYLGIVPPGAFSKVDNLAHNLAFTSSDEIQVEANEGTIGDAPPSYQGPISGPSTRPKIVKQLLAHGFSLVSEDDERHSSYLTGEYNGSKIAVTVRSILVDDAHFVGKARTANATGVLVEID